MKLLMLMIVLPVMALATSLSDGLVAHWKFDGDAKDSSGNGHDLTGGAATWTTDRKGNQTSAAEFDGSGYLTPSSWYSAEDNITISVWVKPGSDITSCKSESLSYRHRDRQSQMILYPSHGGHSTTGRAGVGLLVGRNGVQIVEHADRYYALLLFWKDSIGENWTHVSVTISDNAAPKLYINGSLVQTGLTSNKRKYIGESTYSLTGSSYVAGGEDGNFIGALDDLRIYDRALTEDEVKELSKEAASSEQELSHTTVNQPVPTKAAIERSIKVVNELCEEDYKALRNGSVTSLSFSRKLLSYAKMTKDKAVKFVLYQNAFFQLVVGGEFEKAEDLFDQVMKKCGARYASAMADKADKALEKRMKNYKTVNQVRDLYERTSDVKQCLDAIDDADKELKKTPSNKTLRNKKATNSIKIGEWDKALAIYADETDSKRGEIARWELAKPETRSKTLSAESVGDYWWGVVDGKNEKGLFYESVTRHAAFWYSQALAEGKMSELKSVLIKKRIASINEEKLTAPKASKSEARPKSSTVIEKKVTSSRKVKQECVFQGFMPSTDTLLWKDLSLKDINKIEGFSGGRAWPQGMPIKSSHMKGDAQRRTFQFQLQPLGSARKCVAIELIQRGKDIYGHAIYARYLENLDLAADKDFDVRPFSPYIVADDASISGYGLQNFHVVFE